MKNKDNLIKQFKDKYNSDKKNNYKMILLEINKYENTEKNKLFRKVATVIISLLGTTSIVFASSKIVNEYIIKKDEINSSKLSTDNNGNRYYDIDLTQNDNMLWSEDTHLNYKIITNINDYSKYKSRIEEFPEMSEKEFKTSFIIIIVNNGTRQPHESDLEIFDITADEKTTYVTMKQKSSPNYNNSGNIWYAVADLNILRKNIELEIFNEDIKNDKFVSLDFLYDNYSIKEALKDECIVIENNKIISKNQNAIDEIIEKAISKKIFSTRIYEKSANNNIRVMDLAFNGRIYILRVRYFEDNTIKLYSFNYLLKEQNSVNNRFIYTFKKNENSIEGTPFLIIE